MAEQMDTAVRAELFETPQQKQQKEELRRAALARRDALPEDYRRQASERIMQSLCALPQYREAEQVLTYLSFGSEVETRGLIARAWADGKQVFLPTIIPAEPGQLSGDLSAIVEIGGKQPRREMEFYRYERGDTLVRSRWGLDEPAPDLERRATPAGLGRRVLLVMPGTVFDRQRRRIGYNGGFYDRYLRRNPGASAVAVTFQTQVISEEVPVSALDRLPELVVTEERILG